MTQITKTNIAPLTPERIERGLEWLKHSLPLLNECPDTRKKAEAAVAALSDPAHPAKALARVLALLNPYFDKETPQAIREIEAEDWAVALAEFPYWAIERAARWWMSDENPHRRKRPLTGDIVARVKVEFEAVGAAKFKLARPIAQRAQDQSHQPPTMTEAQREEMRKKCAAAGAEVLAILRGNLAKKGGEP